MGSKKGIGTFLAVGAMAAAAAVLAKKAKDIHDENQRDVKLKIIGGRNYDHINAYFVGGGLASMAGAAYLIRDCNFKAENIFIYEGMNHICACADCKYDKFLCCGESVLNKDTCENFWELFKTIPSLDNPDKNAADEILDFCSAHSACGNIRLADKDGEISELAGMGFSKDDRIAFGKLLITPEEKLDDITVEEWFAATPHFFKTNFWYKWQSMFAFRKCSSVFEFKRSIERMILELSRIDTFEGAVTPPHGKYDSITRPLMEYLKCEGVVFVENCTVTDIEFADGNNITATALHLLDSEGERVLEINRKDLCIMTTGSAADCAQCGDLDTPPEFAPNNPAAGDLWAKTASKNKELGNPAPFFGNPEESNFESFMIIARGNKLLEMIESFSGGSFENGAKLIFTDSNWMMSISAPPQPYFVNQRNGETVLLGRGLRTNQTGNYVKKVMRDCTGYEIFTELLHHMHLEDKKNEIMEDIQNVIPCMMPYAGSLLEPAGMCDRPRIVPENSTNFAMIGKFTEIPEEMVSSEECSVRSARIAVYTLLDFPTEICPVTPYKKEPKVLAGAMKKILS